MKSCGHTNVGTLIPFGASVAFLISLVGVSMGSSSQQVVCAASQKAWANSTDTWSGTCGVHIWQSRTLLAVNVLGLGSVLLARCEFHHDRWASSKVWWHGVVHCAASPVTLCVLRSFAWVTFTFQLVISQALIMLFIALAFLTIICSGSEALEIQAQGLFDSVRKLDGHDDEVLSIRDMLVGIDASHYCSSDRPSLTVVFYFYFGSLLTVASQAAMASSLNGEKCRVSEDLYHLDLYASDMEQQEPLWSSRL